MVTLGSPQRGARIERAGIFTLPGREVLPHQAEMLCWENEQVDKRLKVGVGEGAECANA